MGARSAGGGGVDGEDIAAGDALAQGVEGVEVEAAADAGTDGGGGGAAPEAADWLRPRGDGPDGGPEVCGVRLLDAGFEEVGGLEENCAYDAAAEAGDEVEGCWYIERSVIESRRFGLLSRSARSVPMLLTGRRAG